MKKLFLFTAAALMLMGCGGQKDRAAIPTNDNEVVEKVADAAILMDVDGVTYTTAKVNEVKYGSLVYPALTWRVKAKISGVTDKDPSADKDGVAYVTANLKWTYDSNWEDGGDGPDAAHAKIRQTNDCKAALKAEGAKAIDSKVSGVITFGSASKTVEFSLKLLPKA